MLDGHSARARSTMVMGESYAALARSPIVRVTGMMRP
jgi:hypothetical protein